MVKPFVRYKPIQADISRLIILLVRAALIPDKIILYCICKIITFISLINKYAFSIKHELIYITIDIKPFV